MLQMCHILNDGQEILLADDPCHPVEHVSVFAADQVNSEEPVEDFDKDSRVEHVVVTDELPPQYLIHRNLKVLCRPAISQFLLQSTHFA